MNARCVRTFLRRRALPALLALVVFAGGAAAQEEFERFRLGTAYEQSGEIEMAASIYDELYAAHPDNPAYFDAVVRSDFALKRYDSALVVLRARMARSGTTPALLALVGRAHFHAGRTAQATAAWDSAVALAHDAEAFRAVLGQMTDAHAYDAALRCVDRAMEELHDTAEFGPTRATLCVLLQRYDEATAMYLRLLSGGVLPLAYIESQIGMYTGIEQGRVDALKAVAGALDREPGNLNLRYLDAWLLMEARDYPGAFAQYRAIDDAMQAGGQELLQFAGQALAAGALDVARSAYQTVMDGHHSVPIRAWAAFGAASVGEREWRTTAPDSAPWARAVAQAFDGVARDYAGTLWADSALLLAGRIHMDALDDPDGAGTRAHSLLAIDGTVTRSGEPALLLARVCVARDALDSAATLLTAVTIDRRASATVRPRALFRLAELAFFRGRFDSARAVLGRCLENPGAAGTADAIELSVLLQENADSAALPDLQAFATAGLAARRRDHGAAIARLQDLIRTAHAPHLRDHALMLLGTEYRAIRQPEQARHTYQTILDSIPESPYRDRALMAIGRLYEHDLGDPAAAVRTYESLLEQFPSSIFLDDARARIRALRPSL